MDAGVGKVVLDFRGNGREMPTSRWIWVWVPWSSVSPRGWE